MAVGGIETKEKKTILPIPVFDPPTSFDELLTRATEWDKTRSPGRKDGEVHDKDGERSSGGMTTAGYVILSIIFWGAFIAALWAVAVAENNFATVSWLVVAGLLGCCIIYGAARPREGQGEAA